MIEDVLLFVENEVIKNIVDRQTRKVNKEVCSLLSLPVYRQVPINNLVLFAIGSVVEDNC